MESDSLVVLTVEAYKTVRMLWVASGALAVAAVMLLSVFIKTITDYVKQEKG